MSFYDGRKVTIIDVCQHEYESPYTYIQTVGSPEELAKALIPDVKDMVAAFLKLPEFVEALKVSGFINPNIEKDIADKTVITNNFYLMENYIGKIVDIENVSSSLAERLAHPRAVLLREVDKNSLKDLCPKAYEQMIKTKKRIKAAELARKKNAEARKAKKLQKEIEKAKKLLEQAGEI